MRAAQGRWIGFVDADDWVANTMYSVLSAEAESAGADVAIATGVDVDSTSGAQSPSRDIAGLNEFIALHGRHVIPRNCPDLFPLDLHLGRRLYKREFLDRIGVRRRDCPSYPSFVVSISPGLHLTAFAHNDLMRAPSFSKLRVLGPGRSASANREVR